MQVTRKQLKGIIKECLVEILSEGIGGSLVEATQRPRDVIRQQAVSVPKRRFDPALDRKVNVDRLVKEVSTGNPVLDNILAETARTSMDKIIAEDPSVYGESLQMQVGPADQTGGMPPEQLFGDDVAGNWLEVLNRLEK